MSDALLEQKSQASAVILSQPISELNLYTQEIQPIAAVKAALQFRDYQRYYFNPKHYRR